MKQRLSTNMLKNKRKNIIPLLIFLFLLAGLFVPTKAQSSMPALSIHVNKNHLVNQIGRTIVLRGADRSGTEYACLNGPNISDGPVDNASALAMRSWGLNAVRIPLNEDCWLGINGVSIGGIVYQNFIQNEVHTFVSNGMFVILDLHWSAPGTDRANGQQPMADQDHSIDFWKGVASQFKSNRAVLFDLYNEPDPIPYRSNFPGGFIAWQKADFACVRNGCTIMSNQGISYKVAGMQQMVHAVRSTGALNVLMIGGIQYAQTITQYLDWHNSFNAYLPYDPNGQIAISAHIYSNDACGNTKCWNSTYLPVSLRYPIIVGEFGDTNCSSTLTNVVLPWLDLHAISYLAWNWANNFGCQSLLTNYDGTPSNPYGMAYRDYLNTKKLSLKKIQK